MGLSFHAARKAGQMPEFPKNPHRLTPYPNFRFKVRMGDAYVLGVSQVTDLSRSPQVIQHRDGAGPSIPRLSPGQTACSPITLKRGVSYDPAFQQWANTVFEWSNSTGGATGQNISLLDFRRDLTIEMYNEAGQMVVGYNVYRAWVSEWKAMAELDALGNGIAVESIVLQNEGWERSSPGPVAESSFSPLGPEPLT